MESRKAILCVYMLVALINVANEDIAEKIARYGSGLSPYTTLDLKKLSNISTTFRKKL